MENMLADSTKFERVESASSCDKTSDIESPLQKCFELLRTDLLHENIHQRLRPTSYQLPRMYGLPQNHIQIVLLLPIMYITDSVHYAPSKWLASLLEPVIKRYIAYCIPDLFTFDDYIRRLNKQNDSFTRLLDVCRVFTNVPLEETINIYTEVVYDNPDFLPYFP